MIKKSEKQNQQLNEAILEIHNLDQKAKEDENEAIPKQLFLDSDDDQIESLSSEMETVKSDCDVPKTGRVIQKSSDILVEIVIVQIEGKQELVTINSENVLTIWDIENNSVHIKHNLPVESQVTAGAFDQVN